MADPEEISEVRANTGQLLDVDPYTDDYISGLIDGGDIRTATLAIWISLAAGYSKLVDVTEAGASHKFSDLFKNAQAMIKYWQGLIDGEIVDLANIPRVNYIVREPHV